MADLAETCVVHLVENDVEHDCVDHQVVDYHDVDGVPTSEPCPGLYNCPDCRFVLDQLSDEVSRWVRECIEERGL